MEAFFNAEVNNGVAIACCVVLREDADGFDVLYAGPIATSPLEWGMDGITVLFNQIDFDRLKDFIKKRRH